MGRLSNFFDRWRKAPRPGGPRSVTVELSSHCGYDCTPCPLNFYTETVKRRHAAAEPLLKTFEELAPLDVIDFTGWGEGLLHPELENIVAAAAKAARHVTLTTAGSLLTEEKSRALIEGGLSYLMISLDCASAASYKAIKHKDEFGLVLENIRRFVLLRKKKIPRLSLSFILMRENLNEAVSFAKLAAELKADQIVFKALVPFTASEVGHSLDGRYYVPVPEELSSLAREILDEATRVASEAGIEVARFGKFGEGARHACMAYAEQRPFLRADGIVSPCCMAAYPVERVCRDGSAYPQEPLTYGSVESVHLDEIWNRPDYADFRRALQDLNGELPATCRDCPICHNFEMKVFTPAGKSGEKIVGGVV